MVRIPREIAKRIEGYVTKYMGILGVTERPEIEAYDDPKADWGGRTAKEITTDDEGALGKSAAINVQKWTFKDPRLLERVIAHEMIHVRDWLAKPQEEIEAIIATRDSEPGEKPTVVADESQKKAHGPSFWEGADRINAVMGPDFVTEKEARVRPAAKGAKGENKLILALGFGGLAVLAVQAVMMRRKRGRATSMPVPPPRTVQPRQPRRDNERGRYGRMPLQPAQPLQPPRENERGSYRKKG